MFREKLESQGSEVASIVAVAQQAVEPRLMQVRGLEDGKPVEVLVFPDGQVHSVKQFVDVYRDSPERRQGVARLQTLDSFIEHVKRFADGDSALWADRNPTSPSMTAVLDYHRSGSNGSPRFGEHRSVYAFPLSDEWQAWSDADGKAMDQGTFAAFLEDRIADVSEASEGGPVATLAERLEARLASASRLLELSRGLSVRESGKVTNAVNLSSGEGQLVYAVEHQDEHGAPIKVPGMFAIAIPVFQGGDLFQLAVRLRYRIRSGSITWSCELHRADLVFDTAFREACDKAARETGLPLFYGAPEGA